MKFLSDIRLLLLSVWLGAACFFIAVVQSAFAVLPAREMAGAVVNRTLSVLNYSGLAIAVVLILAMMSLHAFDTVIGGRVQAAFTLGKVVLIAGFIAAGVDVQIQVLG